MPDLLSERLRRVSPVVDDDAALAAFHAGRQRASRRRRATRLGLPVVALLVAGALVADQITGDDSESVVADGGQEVGPRTVTATNDGLQVEITAPAQATAGTRIPVQIRIHNVGDETVRWEAGGCGEPATVTLAPDSSGAVDPTGDENGWDGDTATLPAAVAGQEIPALGLQSPESTGRRMVACPAISIPKAFAPGDVLSQEGTLEVRVPPGPLPDDGQYVVEAAFLAAAIDPSSSESPEGGASVSVTARSTVAVVDDPARGDGATDAAVAAFAADPRLASYVADNALPDPAQPDLLQDYTVELSWWRGAWELWVDPYWQGLRPLRMRFDPVAGAVVDVRTVYLDRAPEDEPGRADVPPIVGGDDDGRDRIL